MKGADEIVAIVSDLLGVEADLSQSFVALGGDSIRAMQASARMKRRTGIAIRPETLLGTVNIEAALAEGEEVEHEDLWELDSRPSRGQEQLFFIEKVGSREGIYNIGTAIHLRGPVDVEKLLEAIRATASLHPALRTVFDDRSEGLRRVVLPQGPEVEVRDLRAPALERQPSYEEVVRDFSCRPLPVDEGPVSRFVLVRRKEELSTVLLIAHHSALDAWAVGLLSEELVGRYLAAVEGGDWEARESPSYDFFVRMEARAKAQWAERDFRWWSEYLRGAPTALQLRSELPRPPRQSYEGARMSFEIDAPQAIRTAARRLEVTPFTFLLAAFGACLRRNAGRRDMLVGISVAGRNLPELHDLVGFCAKTLPVRIAMEKGDEEFAFFARRLQVAVAGVLEHGSVDLGELARLVGVVGDLSRNPLVQVAFAKHDDLIDRGRVGSLEVDFEDLSTGSSPFDLTLYVERLDDIGLGSLEYAKAVLTDGEARAFAAAFARCVGRAREDPQRSLAAVADS